MSRQRIALGLVAAAFCIHQSAAAQTNDPPDRIGRVSDVTGAVSLLPVGQTDWSSASLNYPLTSGDALWADADGRAEVHAGASAIHVAPGTSLSFDAIADDLIQLRIGQGTVQVRLRELSSGDRYEIDTQAGAILLRAPGDYRVDVTPDGRRTTVSVREGDADVLVGNDTYPLRQGTSVTLVGNGAAPIAEGGVLAPDDWERWADGRDRREDTVPATQYVSREMVGYEDLDSYGDWQVDAEYGPVWYPRSVGADWAPYRTGRWQSMQPWGWTWIDEEPWGFAPFHYGRWSHQRGRWGWIPGGERARPVYAPALVAFVSGDGWNVRLSLGSGGGVGWVPLGPNEVFVPPYRNSTAYARRVNVTNVNVNVVDVTRVDVNGAHYANRDIPGAVTAVPRDVFIGSRDVRNANVPVRPADLAGVRITSGPIAGGAAVAPPPPGSPMDRARPDNAGTIRRPPVALSRLPLTPRRPGSDAGPSKPMILPPADPATQPRQPQDQGRDQSPPKPQILPPAIRQPTPAVPQPAIPATLPRRSGPRRTPTTAPAPRPPVPASASPAAPATIRTGRPAQPAQPAPQQATPAPTQRPTSPVRTPATPPQKGRAAEPARARPDSGHGHSPPAPQLFYQE